MMNCGGEHKKSSWLPSSAIGQRGLRTGYEATYMRQYSRGVGHSEFKLLSPAESFGNLACVSLPTRGKTLKNNSFLLSGNFLTGV